MCSRTGIVAFAYGNDTSINTHYQSEQCSVEKEREVEKCAAANNNYREQDSA